MHEASVTAGRWLLKPPASRGSVIRAKAEEILRKADKQRASYYNYYATGTWGDVNNYDLCVDTGTLGIEGCVELICKCVEIKQNKAERKTQNDQVFGRDGDLGRIRRDARRS